MKILLLDNYDSFTFNLLHYMEQIEGTEISVFRNDEIALDSVENFDKILLSPGPGLPADAGIMLPLIRRYASTKSILGICLGHQAIAEVFGGKLFNMNTVQHGVSATLNVVQYDVLYDELPERFKVGRYHSWSVDEAQLPNGLIVSAKDEEGQIMSLFHKNFFVRGVQFHPESILTEHGMKILMNWVNKG